MTSHNKPLVAWPPNYRNAYISRYKMLGALRADPQALAVAKAHYRNSPVDFIQDWLTTFDPRNVGTDTPTRMPFILFEKQVEYVQFLKRLIVAQESGLVEKSRDMGATWVSCAFTIWLWVFHAGSSVGWGSRKEALVDRLGDPDSIFEKLRLLIDDMPSEFLPDGFNRDQHLNYMKIINPENGSTITGESGDNIGRGGRSSIYFLDEAAHVVRPESIEAALGDNTNVRVDVSSVNGLGNPFHRRRESGVEFTGGDIVKGRANVFVMSWQDHPGKTQAWHDKRRDRAEREGMIHVFEQEVDRNYAASVEGILIPGPWFDSSVDAHITLDIDMSGGYVAGQDVADSGGDKNAFVMREGLILRECSVWSGSAGDAARRALGMCGSKEVSLQYDSIGVGVGFRTETNRLSEQGNMPAGISIVPWNAGAAVRDKDHHVIPDDTKSPLNGEVYENLKSQASWELRRRMEKTHLAVTEGHQYPVSELISIDSEINEINTLKKELGQITMGKSSRLKMITEKSPEGTKSPNLADAAIMCYFPVPEPADAGTFDQSQFGF